MGEAKEIWKRLFFVLLNNTQPDDSMPSMWAQFKTERLKESELRIVIESISDLLSDGVKGSLSRLLGDEEKTCNANLLYAMRRLLVPAIQSSQRQGLPSHRRQQKTSHQ